MFANVHQALNEVRERVEAQQSGADCAADNGSATAGVVASALEDVLTVIDEVADKAGKGSLRPAWRPVEYYDGTFAVMLHDPRVGPFIGGKDANGWYILGYETQYHDDELSPTHWTELPAAP